MKATTDEPQLPKSIHQSGLKPQSELNSRPTSAASHSNLHSNRMRHSLNIVNRPLFQSSLTENTFHVQPGKILLDSSVFMKQLQNNLAALERSPQQYPIVSSNDFRLLVLVIKSIASE